MAGATEILGTLQQEQREHDARAHQDIFHLSYPDRMRHLTFHVAKYAGRLARPMSATGDPERTIVDAFIVGLSAANVLRIDLGEAVAELVSIGEHATLSTIGRALNTDGLDGGIICDWYFRELAEAAGRMAKACESLDHMEAVPYREMLSGAILRVCRATLVAASIMGVDLEAAVGARWREIESAKVL